MFRLAWRRLRATPLFTTFAVISLAAGVGATTAIYSVIVSVTTSGMSVPRDNGIFVVVGNDPLNAGRQAFRSILSRGDFRDLGHALTTAGPLAGSAPFYQSVVDGTVSEAVPGEAVTGNYFGVLGLLPALGRLLQPDDDAGASRVVVVSHRFWRTRLSADPGVIGRTLRLGGEPFEIVGVAPDGFGGLTGRFQAFTAVWVPLSSTALFPSNAAPPADPEDRRRRQLTAFAVLPSGSRLETIAGEVTAIGSRLDAAWPIDMRGRGETDAQVVPRRWSVRTLDAVSRDVEAQFAMLELGVTAIVGLVLVVAATNLANLMLARGTSRLPEMALRSALGASRARLVGEHLTEPILLAAMGSAGALLLTRLLLVWFSGAALPVSEAVVVLLDPRLDVRTLGLGAVSMLAALVIFGLAPALRLTGTELRSVLSAEPGSTGHARWRTRRTLVAVQVMIALSFFLMAAFAVRVLRAERGQPPGIDVDRLAMGVLNFQLPPWNEPLAREAIDALMTLAPSQPGLDAAAVASGLPFGTTYTPVADLARPDRPFLPGRADYTFAPLVAATPSIFSTLGVPMLRGRGFDARDGAGAQPVIVLSALAARQLFGTTDVVGRECLLRLRGGRPDAAGARTLTVIGVAGDTDTQRRGSRHAGAVYVPLAQHFEPVLVLLGRTAGDPAGLVTTLRSLAQRADPDLVLDRASTAALAVTGMYVLVDVVSRLAGALAALALGLGMVGLFGVLSHLVSRRTREMGLRMAVGADPRQIRLLVLGDGLQPVGSGLAMGYLLAAGVRLLVRVAYNSPLSAGDALVFLLAPLPIVAAAILASYWPARRASRVHPNAALRDDG